jgi:hypothetical protein
MRGRVWNLHERQLSGIEVAQVRAAVGTIATPGNQVWPGDRWPALRLDTGLVVGAVGGHGPIRYSVEAIGPDEIVFRFDPGMGVTGVHRFDIIDAHGATSVRHTIIATMHGSMRVLWPLVIEPLHDALIEDAFDGLEAVLADVPVRRKTFSAGIRVRRWSIRLLGRVGRSR